MTKNLKEERCYFNCIRDGPLHMFPTTVDERFIKWKEVLDKTTQEKGFSYIYNNIRFCYRHFEKYYQLRGRYLTFNAVPTINLKQRSKQTEVSTVPSVNAEPKTLNLTKPGAEQTEVSTVSSINPEPKILNFTMPDNEDCILGDGRLKPIPKEDIKVVPPLRKPPEPQKNNSDVLSVSPSKPEATPSVGVSQESSINAKINATLHNQYLTIRKLRKENLRLKDKNERQQHLIKELRRTRWSNMINKLLSKFPEPIKTFTKLQLKFKKKPRGRRFTTEEKEMALEIFRKSIPSYLVLKKMFVLPSIKCLRKYIREKSIKNSEDVWVLEVGAPYYSHEVTISSE